MTETKVTEDARIGALETKVNALTETVSRIEADFAMLGDRPALETAPLDGAEVQHIRAVLSRFASDAPPAPVSDDE